MSNIDAAGIDTLKAILERSSDLSQDGPDLVQNYDFHFTLYRMSGSDVLLHIIEALWLQYGSYLNLIINHCDVLHIQEHKFHSAIINALEQNDRGAAQAALIGDIEQSFSVLQNYIDTPLSPT
jgi:DNA-binding GntR family transcriptional regulator